MQYRLLRIVPLIAAAALPSSAAQSQSTGLSYVVAAPYEGHPGDTIYVTGAGLPPGKQEFLTLACPDALTAGGNYELVAGPKTDVDGHFTAFPIHALAPAGLTQPLPCTIYASVGAQYFGPDIRAKYLILPPHQRLNPCASHICGAHVTASPVRVRYGLAEKISVRDPGWPGATATVGLAHGTGSPDIRTIHLDYHGSATIQWPIRWHVSTDIKSFKVAVRVHLQLGAIGGKSAGSFTVIR